jgi:catechol 2,3-dioxygenase-like lactoylglutathione lyase family enzyme
MAIERMDHIGIVVNDLDDAIEFFVALGLEPLGDRVLVEGQWVDDVVGLTGARSEIAFVQTPDGQTQLELTQFQSPLYEGDDPPPPANAPGIRHLTFRVDDIDAVLEAARAHGAELVGELGRYKDIYRLCYVRGPAGIIVELAQKIG